MIGLEVQKAIFDSLKASSPVAGGRIYDDVPENPTFPYVSIGEEQVVEDGNSCGDGWEVFADVSVWSRAVGFPESKTLAAIATSRIRAISSIAGFNLVSVDLTNSLPRRDPDGKTSRVVLTFRFLIDQA